MDKIEKRDAEVIKLEKLKDSILGKWDQIEPAGDQRDAKLPEYKVGEEWHEFRADGTLRRRISTTIETVAYEVDAGDQIKIQMQGNVMFPYKVVLLGDELTIFYGTGEGIRRFRKSAK